MSPGIGGRIAVVDVGSNSTRLLLCEGIAPAGPEGARFTTVTGLRRGAGPDGSLADAALARLDDVLGEFGARVRAFGPVPTAAVGTSAVREAPNRDRVARLVGDRLGCPLVVVSGEEEAHLAFTGARLALAGPEEAMVIDVGGGSAELVRGGPDGPTGAISMPLGAVRGTDRHLHHDPPLAEELKALRAEVAGSVPGALRAIGGPAPALGVAGTMTTLAAIDLGAYDPERVHRHRLTRERIEGLTAMLAALDLERRREVPGLDPARAPVIVAGAAMVAEILHGAGLPDVLISERDILDGIVLAVAARRLAGFADAPPWVGEAISG